MLRTSKQLRWYESDPDAYIVIDNKALVGLRPQLQYLPICRLSLFCNNNSNKVQYNTKLSLTNAMVSVYCKKQLCKIKLKEVHKSNIGNTVKIRKVYRY